MKNHVFCYNFSCVNICEIRICHLLHLFIRYTTLCIENSSDERANSHFTIWTILTFTHNFLRTES